MREHFTVEEHAMSNRGCVFDELRKCARGFFEVAGEQLDAGRFAMQLAADPVVFLFCPDSGRAHPVEYLGRRLDRAREHETHRLKKGDAARLELTPLASDRRLSDVARDEVHALHLSDRNSKGFGDGGLHEPFAEADPHLSRDDLDEKASALGVQSSEQGFERLGFRVAAGGADRLQRCFDVGERDGSWLGAAVEGFARPVAKV